MPSERSNAQLREIIRTQTEIATSDLDPKAIMQLIAERAQQLTRSSSGVIELAEGEDMVYAVTTGEATPYLGTSLKRATSLSGLCVREGKVLRSDDTGADPRVDAVACRRVNAASMICVPLSPRRTSHPGEATGLMRWRRLCRPDLPRSLQIAASPGPSSGRQQRSRSPRETKRHLRMEEFWTFSPSAAEF